MKEIGQKLIDQPLKKHRHSFDAILSIHNIPSFVHHPLSIKPSRLVRRLNQRPYRFLSPLLFYKSEGTGGRGREGGGGDRYATQVQIYYNSNIVQLRKKLCLPLDPTWPSQCGQTSSTVRLGRGLARFRTLRQRHGPLVRSTDLYSLDSGEWVNWGAIVFSP